MQRDVDRVMRAGIETEELAIKHVRDGRERVPVLRMHMRKRPLHALRRHAAANVRILQNVKRIVVINEAVMARLAEDEPDKRDNA